MSKTYSVWPRPFSEKSEVTLDSIETLIKEDGISQQEVFLFIINQMRVMNRHLSEMTDLENTELLKDVELKGDVN